MSFTKISTNFMKHLVSLILFACHKKDLPPYDDAFTQKQLSICIVSMSVCQNDLINRHGLCCFVGLIVCLLMAFAHAVRLCHKGNFGCKVTSIFLGWFRLCSVFLLVGLFVVSDTLREEWVSVKITSSIVMVFVILLAKLFAYWCYLIFLSG